LLRRGFPQIEIKEGVNESIFSWGCEKILVVCEDTFLERFKLGWSEEAV
jgi:hypothetical protein